MPVEKHFQKNRMNWYYQTRLNQLFWLTAFPSTYVGTFLDNNTFRISIALRIGCDICVKCVRCVCEDIVTIDASHGLTCSKSTGKHPRHAELNNILFIILALQSANIPSIREPPGLFRNDKKILDGMTLMPFSRDQMMVWDATCSTIISSSFIISLQREIN